MRFVDAAEPVAEFAAVEDNWSPSCCSSMSEPNDEALAADELDVEFAVAPPNDVAGRAGFVAIEDEVADDEEDGEAALMDGDPDAAAATAPGEDDRVGIDGDENAEEDVLDDTWCASESTSMSDEAADDEEDGEAALDEKDPLMDGDGDPDAAAAAAAATAPGEDNRVGIDGDANAEEDVLDEAGCVWESTLTARIASVPSGSTLVIIVMRASNAVSSICLMASFTSSVVPHALSI